MTASSPERDAIWAASRFGLGIGIAGFSEIARDVRGALIAEIEAGPALFDPALPNSAALLRDVYVYQMEKQALRAAKPKPSTTEDMSMMTTSMPSMPSPATPSPQVPEKNPVRETLIAEIETRYDDRYHQPLIGFNERLAMFWANHFAVAIDKSQAVAITAGAFEREAIRPHVFGRFEDMLAAVESHPTMLLYLDNQTSIGPNSRGNRAGKRGLNENLAREILELHTLGVDGGYSQADVTAFARIITGWTVMGKKSQGDQEPGTFFFNPNNHEPGQQTVLGRRYDEDGFSQGRKVLADLARHPATAHHIAVKLVRHFIHDNPPKALVAQLASTYRKSDGDLSAVYRVLIAAPEALSSVQTKIRLPQEYMAAMLRLTNTRPKGPAIVAALKAMGQPQWTPGGPNGFSDASAVWTSPEALSTRMEVANLSAEKLASQIDARELFESRFGPVLSDTTRQAIARAESRAQGLAIGLLSPEMMRR